MISLKDVGNVSSSLLFGPCYTMRATYRNIRNKAFMETITLKVARVASEVLLEVTRH